MICLLFFVICAHEYINIDNSSFLALDKSDHAQWTCTENHFWSEKLVLILWQRQKCMVDGEKKKDNMVCLSMIETCVYEKLKSNKG